MKAIYLNIDPYLAAFAAWLKANPADPDTGEFPTSPPSFNTLLPLAVTIPLGETAAIFCPVDGGFEGANNNEATIDGTTIKFAIANNPSTGDEVATDVVPGLSALAPTAKYSVATIPSSVSSVVASLFVCDEDDSVDITVPFTVLVRRETASGPVDLVDFTPPASGGTPSAADIRSALVADGDGALAGVKLGGAIILAPLGAQEIEDATRIYNGDSSFALEYIDSNDAAKVLGSSSFS